jgi:hypothetical protein
LGKAELIWDSVVAKLSREGRDSLSASERTFYLLNRFLVDFEMGGLSGLLYNLSSASPSELRWEELRATAQAARSAGQPEAALTLEKVADLLEALPRVEGTWESFLRPIAAQLPALEASLNASSEPLWDRLDELAAEIKS